ncbi:sugar-binding domain-containing protein [Okibacterium endophyticum]
MDHNQRASSAPSEDISPSERSRVLAAARLFYLEDRSKIEIADSLGVSRFKVARMLELAKSLGLITITLNDEGIIDEALSAELADHLGLREAVVVEVHGDDDAARHEVGRAAAELLSTTLTDGEVLGMSWGRTLSAMTESLPNLPAMSIVQLTGAAGANIYQSPVELVRKVAQNSGGSAHPIFAPLVVGDPEIAAALRSQSDIAKALAMFSEITTAVMSIGAWSPPESQLYESVHPEHRDALVARGVVAEIASTLVAADGSEIAPDFAERCISVTSEQLRRIPRVIAVAAGARKALAVASVARAGLISGIVTDRALAEQILGRGPRGEE